MKISKKISKVLLLTFIIDVVLSSCASKNLQNVSSNSTQTNNVQTTQIDETSSKIEIQTNSKTEVETEMQTEKETEPETALRYFTILPVGHDYYTDFLIENKDLIIKNFDNKIFTPGEVYNCHEEMNAIGLDIDKYGKSYAFIYSYLCDLRSFLEFEIIEDNYNSLYNIEEVDTSHNFILKNNNKRKFKINLTYTNDESDNLQILITFLD